MFPPVYPGQLLYLTCMFTVLLLLGYYSGTKLHCITLFNNVILVCIPNLIGSRHLSAVVCPENSMCITFCRVPGDSFSFFKSPGEGLYVYPSTGALSTVSPGTGAGVFKIFMYFNQYYVYKLGKSILHAILTVFMP